MITGQPESGKSTLARALQYKLKLRGCQTILLDGDMWRDMTLNKDYTEHGRRLNLSSAYQTALLLEIDYVVIMAFVAPYRDMRERIKAITSVAEVYTVRPVEVKHKDRQVADYEPPERNYVMVVMTRPIDAVVHEVLEYVVRLGLDDTKAALE